MCVCVSCPLSEGIPAAHLFHVEHIALRIAVRSVCSTASSEIKG